MGNWYVVYTKPRQESVAQDNLQRQSFETYFPRIKELRRYKGKWRHVIEPLFPRYLFISLEMGVDNISTIRYTRGVTGLVRFSDEPAYVPQVFVESLRRTADKKTGIHMPKRPQFEAGDEVIVLEGPLAGLHGIFQATKSEERVIILLDILGRANSVTLSYNQITNIRN